MTLSRLIFFLSAVNLSPAALILDRKPAAEKCSDLVSEVNGNRGNRLRCFLLDPDADCGGFCRQATAFSCPINEVTEYPCRESEEGKVCCCAKKCEKDADIFGGPIGGSDPDSMSTRKPKHKKRKKHHGSKKSTHSWPIESTQIGWKTDTTTVKTTETTTQTPKWEPEETTSRSTTAGWSSEDVSTRRTAAESGSKMSGEAEGSSKGSGESGKNHGKGCKENILEKYPDAQCFTSKDKSECRKKCEEKGEVKCKGGQGEIHKLNCKGEHAESGQMTCCCSIKCEKKEITQSRLNEEFAEEVGETSGICTDVSKDRIKERLKEMCSTEDKVFIARKFCIEEKNGAYFCVKDGKCFGDQCKGCIKHECEIDGQKNIINPPESYVDLRLEKGDFDKNAVINVDDMKNTQKNRRWCTSIEDRGKCRDTCKDFGDQMCGNPERVLKYDHVDSSKRGEKNATCCCQPVCKASNSASTIDPQKRESTPRPEMASEENPSQERSEEKKPESPSQQKETENKSSEYDSVQE